MNRSVKIGLWLIGILTLCLIYAFVDPTNTTWLPRCPFLRLTSWQCPGCGAQRAFHALLQGNLQQALAYNYFLLPTMLYMMAYFMGEIWPKGTIKQRIQHYVSNRYVVTIYIVLCIAWLIARNVWGL